MKLPFATTCMDLEGTIISRISQTKTDIVWYHLYVESKKKKKAQQTSKYNKRGDSQIRRTN